MDKEKENILVENALNPGPLLHLLSIRIQPNNIGRKKTFGAVYGLIYVEHFGSTYGDHNVHYLYNRPRTHPEVLDTDGTLTLNWPSFRCDPGPHSALIPMFINKMNVQLFDEDDNLLVDHLSLDDTEIEGGYEQVKSQRVPCLQPSLSLVVDYIAIPFGYSTRLSINFCSPKHKSVNANGKHNSINVNGKIVATWVNTYGSYSSEECVLFKKDPNAFETVQIDGPDMLLSRCWVPLPAYSSLVIHVNLSDYDSGREIVGAVQLQIGGAFGCTEKIYLDDMYIQVCLAWVRPAPLGRYAGKEEMDTEEDDEEEMDTEEDDEVDRPLSNPDIPRYVTPMLST